MLGAYVSFLLVLVASAVVGQAVMALAGRRNWSWLAPAVGLAVLTCGAWGMARLPGEGIAVLVALGAVSAASALYLRHRVAGTRVAIARGLPVAALALLAGSLPFIIEGRVGILGTGLNPDMSQHLLATERLASGEGGRLLSEGYPLGPHALVVGLSELGPSLVEAFDGLTLTISVIAALTALAALADLTGGRRLLGALLVGLPYMAASFLIQGAFKEAMQALFVLAFALALHEVAAELLAGDRPGAAYRPGASPPGGQLALGALPLPALAVGSAYAYSFTGLLWLAGTAGLWILGRLALRTREDSLAGAAVLARRAAPAAGAALLMGAAALAPEVGRMVRFASFETFDPDGPGLGNLFNPISPLEALGIWPSGDYRLDPGAGAMPAVGFYVGGALGVAALAYGLWWWLRRRELAAPTALAVASALYVYTLVAGTPYQESKAIAIAAPLAMLVSVRALLQTAPRGAQPQAVLAGTPGRGSRPGALDRGRWPRSLAGRALSAAFLSAAGFCSLLALVNGPVGPASYSPALTELRPLLRGGSTLVLASKRALEEEHARDFLAWELRGTRVCVEEERRPSQGPAPPGVAHVLADAEADAPPFARLRRERSAGPYLLWDRRPVPDSGGSCPFIATSQRAEPSAAQP